MQNILMDKKNLISSPYLADFFFKPPPPPPTSAPVLLIVTSIAEIIAGSRAVSDISIT